MIKRYEQTEIAEIWSDENKLKFWQEVELAVIWARATLGEFPREIYQEIEKILKTNPIDLDWWKKREAEIKHDLNAFVDERLRFLPPLLQIYLHKKITSYDTEEPAMSLMLLKSVEIVETSFFETEDVLEKMAGKYRYTVMNGRTHGQEAVLQSFGKRCLTWLGDLRLDLDNLKTAVQKIKHSKISGAIGNYGSLNPEMERLALQKLGLRPYYGATQIMPREIHAPLAQSLSMIVQTLNKIAMSIRLGARSGRPIFQEPFGKKQKGSSAMPHKKNTISTEQIEGMARMAKNLSNALMENIPTWEERSIEQSCVERMAWPDLFHVVIHSLKTMKRVLSGLRVYPDNMLLEIIDSRGCYASDEAKEVLKKMDFSAENAYRIIQLAAFNAFEPDQEFIALRENPPSSLEEADFLLNKFKQKPELVKRSIQEIIAKGELKISEHLEATTQDVNDWNICLKEIFKDSANLRYWDSIFQPSFLLKNESILFEKILSV